MFQTKIKFLYLIVLAVLFAACSDSTQVKPEQEYLDAAQQKLEAQDFQGAIDEYEALIKNYPSSPGAITAYNQIAGIYFESLKDYEKSIETYKRLAEAFPDSKEAKQSLFMVAFIYDETLKNKEEAIAAYNTFLAKYPEDTDPNDKMSESAKMMLQVLEGGQSIEDMIMKQIETAGDKTVDTDTKVETEGNLKKIETPKDGSADDDTKDVQEKKKEDSR